MAPAPVIHIDNAATHTPPGSRIGVSLTIDGACASVVVTDDGPGIAAADRALALRRFGRLDASRNTPGHGLGLPLVAAIARLHRGGIDLADGAPGLRVTLKLPLA